MDKESAGEIQTKSDCTKSTNNLIQGLKAVKNEKSNKGRAAKSLSFGQNVKKKVEARRYFQGSSPWIEEASSKELRNVKLFWKVKSHTGLQPNKNQAGWGHWRNQGGCLWLFENGGK